MIDRLNLVDSVLAVRMQTAGPEEHRELACAVALAAAEHCGLTDERLAPALAGLRRRSTELPGLAAATAVADESDQAALLAHYHLDTGGGTESDYARAFIRARASMAVVAALDPDPTVAVTDTLYEAYHAFDADRDAFHRVIDHALPPATE